MASYVIAGRADDASFARAEFAAKQIEAACPSVTFRFEMKHPDVWKEFICSVFRQYDFHGFPEDFPGPLVWTHEGDLVGSGADFVQKVCIEKFGIRDPPSLSDPAFKQIAADNLKQVKQQVQREQLGPPFAEKCEATYVKALAEGLVSVRQYREQRRVVVAGSYLEVWISDKLREEWAGNELANRSDNQPATLDERLQVGTTGQDNSHMVLVHPKPICRKQLVLVSRKQLVVPPEEVQQVSLLQDGMRIVQVPHHGFRKSPVPEDLSVLDFQAAMEVLAGVPGIATWTGLTSGGEIRNAVDTHIQVLPLPLHSQGEGTPLRYPLELLVDAALREGTETLKVFPFRHVLCSVMAPDGTPDDRRKHPKVLAQAALNCYEDAKSYLKHSGSCAVAFTSTWLLYVPLAPPDASSAANEAWLQMPTPPACALAGVVVAPTVDSGFPETAGMKLSTAGGKMVSNRAVEEGIPEGTPEYDAASREVRIAAAILNNPGAIIGVWVA